MDVLSVFIARKRRRPQETDSHDAPPRPTVEKQKEHHDADFEHIHWSYHEEESAPDKWQDLCGAFSACGGTAQSPIDIVPANAQRDAHLKPIQVHYGKTKVNIVNNGHTIQFNVDEGNTANFNGKEYKLQQFHFHALSEHTVNGQHFPIEAHFVHKLGDNDLAVLGIFFKEGKSNPLFEKYLDNFPAEKGNFTAGDELDLMSILPGDLSYYTYNGSLTTPPCSEIVTWYVLKTPVEASREQIERFSKILHDNYRPTQPLNGRRVETF